MMLSEEGCRSRRGRLWEALPPNVKWVLIADPRHVNYLSDFWVNPVSLSAGERGLLYLERGGEAVLCCDNFALNAAVGPPFVDRTIVEPWYDQRHGVPNRDHVLFKALERIGNRLRRAGGLLETEWLPVGALEAIGLAAPASAAAETAPAGAGGGDALPGAGGGDQPTLGTLLRDLRRQKDPDELALLRHSIRAGEAGQRRARELVRPGISEFELFREIQSAALAELGYPALLYGDFRATSPALPNAGGPPTEHVLREGEIFISDFSVVVGGYRGDFTASILVGAPSAGQRELLELCRAAMAGGQAALKPGTTGREVYQAVAAPFAAAGRPEAFPHHAGHGLGLGHPEAPSFVPESDEVLRAQEVVTLEPGAYVEGIGGLRLEHNYRITEAGFERLTHHSLEL
ncbi:MAG: aminopeptidase P family protein [Spirochaetales bacterium]|nr:aminopeptidase P family protein [Spirochaetales bacterium]